MRLWFWQNIVSPHQSALLQALARHPDVDEVHLIAAEAMTSERQRLGWEVPEMPGVTLTVAPSQDGVAQLASSSAADVIHVFSGVGGPAQFRTAFDTLARRGARLGVMAETAHKNGALSGALRLIKYRLMALRYHRQIRFILAISQLAVQWYALSGFAQRAIYPFAYFTDPLPATPAAATTEQIAFLMVGRCDAIKGGEEFLHALAAIAHLPWTARHIGHGPAEDQWKALAAQLGLADRVQFLGQQPPVVIAGHMQASDTLVLYNRYSDGWGVVVNEALLAGTPVLCSTLTGAKDVVSLSPQAGKVLPPRQTNLLAEALSERVAAGKVTADHRHELSRWAEARLGGDAGAAYLVNLLRHALDAADSRPAAPWLPPE
ncbi:glycosyltransferase [Deinococcus navajonensis]|uniref:Glycosyltransferase n=1 Tax=Deinococcus navajonensis TaxID=309884 RepID=A0ABV8XQY7_9DEIO